jgi:hypothetical protein
VSAVAAAEMIDDLWRQSVQTPLAVDDTFLADWMAEAGALLGPPLPKGPARVLRRAVRDARKLARYWQEHDPTALPDWRNGVDEALGAAGWEPQLDLVRWSLEESPDAAAFEDVKRRFPAVNFTPWMEGVSFEEWMAGR